MAQVDREHLRGGSDRAHGPQPVHLRGPRGEVEVGVEAHARQLEQHRVVRPAGGERDRLVGQHPRVGGVQQPVPVGTGDVVQDRRPDRVAAVTRRQGHHLVARDVQPLAGADGRQHDRRVGPRRRRRDDGGRAHELQRATVVLPAPPHERGGREVVLVGVGHEHGLDAGEAGALAQRRPRQLGTEVEQEPVVDEDAGLAARHALGDGGGAGRARAPGVGPAVGRPGAEQSQAHGPSLPHRPATARRGVPDMAWTWRYEGPDGAEVQPAEGAPTAESFPNQSDAESWIGETWRELLDAGVHQVVLLDGDHRVYGPMGLNAS